MNRLYKFIFGLSVSLNILMFIGLAFLFVKFKSELLAKIASYRSHNIVMFGDSLIFNANWNDQLNRNDIYNAGTPGFTTSHFVWILNEKVIKYRPKICFLEGGINDISVGIPLHRTFSNFESIVDSLIKYKVEPVLQSTLYVNYDADSLVNMRVDSLNLYLRMLAKKRNIQFLDINSQVSANRKLKKELTYDGTHLNDEGYKKWRLKVVDILKEKSI